MTTLEEIVDNKTSTQLESIKQILISRDEMSEEDADRLIVEAKEQLLEYLADDDLESAAEICEEYFGLEQDYIMELIP